MNPIAHWSHAMKAYRTQQPTAWKRHALVVSVVVTGASAFIPWGEIEPGDEQTPGHRKSNAVPVTVPSDQASWDQEQPFVLEELPPVAFAPPLGEALERIGPIPHDLPEAKPALEVLDSSGPRRRSIAPKLQSGREARVPSARISSTSFVEVSDGVYEVVGAVAAANEPSGGDVVPNPSGAQTGGLDHAPALALDRIESQALAQGQPPDGAPREIPGDVAVLAERPTSATVVALTQDSASSPGEPARTSTPIELVPEAVQHVAVAAEGLTAAPALATDDVASSPAPEDVSRSLASVGVPPEAVSVVGEPAVSPATAPAIASIAGESSAQDEFVPSLDAAPSLDPAPTLAQPDPPALARPGLLLNDAAAVPAAQLAGRAEAQAPQASLPVHINGVKVGNLPFVVDSHDMLSVSVAGLLDLVRPSMRPDTFEQLRSSRAASGYVSFEALRKAGFAVTFDNATNSLTLSANTR